MIVFNFHFLFHFGSVNAVRLLFGSCFVYYLSAVAGGKVYAVISGVDAIILDRMMSRINNATVASLTKYNDSIRYDCNQGFVVEW